MTARWPRFLSECLRAYRKYIIIFTPQACQLHNSQNYAPRQKYPTLEAEATIFFYKDQHGIFPKKKKNASAEGPWHQPFATDAGNQQAGIKLSWMMTHVSEHRGKKGHSACFQGSRTADTTFTESLNTGANSMTKSFFWYALAKWPWTSNLVFLRFMVLGLLRWE